MAQRSVVVNLERLRSAMLSLSWYKGCPTPSSFGRGGRSQVPTGAQPLQGQEIAGI